MAGDEIIRIKSVNDGKGANDAKKDLKEVGDEAERTSARTAAANARAENSFAHIQKGIAGVRRAMGTLNAILSGFGRIAVGGADGHAVLALQGAEGNPHGAGGEFGRVAVAADVRREDDAEAVGGGRQAQAGGGQCACRRGGP